MPIMIPLELEAGIGQTLHRQLEDQLRAAILDGRLHPGAVLPGIRQLARQFGVAPITVRTAYDQLVAEGYLVARTGSGTRVAPDLPDEMLRAAPRRRGGSGKGAARLDADRLPSPSPELPDATYFAERPVPGALPYDFRPARPDVATFPLELWERLIRQAWRDLTRSSSLDYTDPRGDMHLRSVVAAYLAASRAVHCTTDQVVITSGAQASFDVAARLWLGGSRACVVEDPGYPMAWRTLRAAGTRVLPVPVDAQGLVTDALPAQASAALITPSWQYPAGGTLPLSRRLELLRWAREQHALIIEDDYDSELRYEGRPLASLQGIDEDGRVLYVGTLSKVTLPALRLGYAVIPRDAVERFLATLEVGHRGVAAIEQLAMARFIEHGHFDRHLRRMRLHYAARQELLIAELRRQCGSAVAVSPAPAGMHLVITITDESVRATEVAALALGMGVDVVPMAAKRLRPAPDRELLVGYTGVGADEIRAGVRILSTAISRATRGRAKPDGSSVAARPRHRASRRAPGSRSIS